MPFVERNPQGDIIGLYGGKQPGRVEEFLAETHPDVIAFRANADHPSGLSAEELYDMLVVKGVVADTDRPRPRRP